MVAIVGLIASVAAMRFGESTLGVTDGQGYARKLALGLQLARRQAITEGVNSALRIQRSSGAVTGFDIARVTSGGDVPTEGVIAVSSHLSVTAPADRWEFDYTGSMVSPATSTLRIDSTSKYWDVTVYAASGRVIVAEHDQP